jgi:hypothetical protein
MRQGRAAGHQPPRLHGAPVHTTHMYQIRARYAPGLADLRQSRDETKHVLTGQQYTHVVLRGVSLNGFWTEIHL